MGSYAGVRHAKANKLKFKGDKTMGRYVMALDQGTTSSRCILFDEQGAICSVAQKEFTQIFPQPGWVEHNPCLLYTSSEKCCE